MPRRVGRFEAAPDAEITRTAQHRLVWQGQDVARLRPGHSVLRPLVEVIGSDFLDGPLRERVRRRCQAFIDAEIATAFAPLFAALEAGRGTPKARGLLHRLAEGMGIARAEAEDSAAARSVRLVGGGLAWFLPTMMKPAPMALRAALLALGHNVSTPALPLPSLTAIPAEQPWPAGFAAGAGLDCRGSDPVTPRCGGEAGGGVAARHQGAGRPDAAAARLGLALVGQRRGVADGAAQLGLPADSGAQSRIRGIRAADAADAGAFESGPGAGAGRARATVGGTVLRQPLRNPGQLPRERRQGRRGEAMSAKAGKKAAPHEADWQRLDLWLWCARVAKGRSDCAQLVEDGAVRLNRQPTVKAHAKLRIGDVLSMGLRGEVRVWRVLALAARRGPAAEARLLYEELLETGAEAPDGRNPCAKPAPAAYRHAHEAPDGGAAPGEAQAEARDAMRDHPGDYPEDHHQER